jgi:dTDP-4-dehydrorhamnose reductase
MIMDASPRNIVVIGTSGRLGSVLAGHLAKRHRVTGFGRREIDLADPASITAALAALDYDRLILTGALTAVDACETRRQEAFAVNARGPGVIAAISARKGAHVTYISTDMVFGGDGHGFHQESDVPEPVSVYGASKLAGEQCVLEASTANLVARVSWVFGPSRPAFPEWIIGQAAARADLTLPADKTACPTYTLDLVEWLEALVCGAAGPAAGVFHLCNAGACTWRDWGQACIDAAREAGHPLPARAISGIPLDSVEAFTARRPLNSAMDTRKFTEATGIRPRGWHEALREHVARHIPPPV